jgi:hypothetical protein
MRRLAVVPALLAALASPAAAQQDSILIVAVRLATEGQGDSARALVRGELERRHPSDSLYAELLYAGGVVAADPDEARLFLRRVSIEFSQSPWADEALLRLAQLAFAEQDYEGAARAAERVLLDYPFGNTVGEAHYWAGRSNLELGNALTGCEQLRGAQEAAGADVELMNRVRYYLLRCSMVRVGPGTDSAPAVAPPAPVATMYTVQIAALQSASAADELMRLLHAAGYPEVRVVQEGGFLKVRVGRFARRGDAAALVPELARKFGGTPFVAEER